MALGTPGESCHAFPMWTDQRGSEVLPLAECVRLLAMAAKRGQTGRLAVSTEQAPIIQPVNFTYHEHRIVVRLGSGHLAEVIPGTLVAFEVDHVDRDAHEAWSVLVRGLATALEESDPQPTSDVGPAPLVPAPGDRAVRRAPGRGDGTAVPAGQGRRSCGSRCSRPGPRAFDDGTSPLGAQGAFNRSINAPYCMRCLSPTKLSRTWRRAFPPSRATSSGRSRRATDRVSEPVQVAGIVEEHAGPRRHLLDDAAHRRGDDRLRLPHTLGHRQAEALGQALLHDDGGVTLQRVDHRRVLVLVVHGEHHESDPPPLLGG